MNTAVDHLLKYPHAHVGLIAGNLVKRPGKVKENARERSGNLKKFKF